MDKILNIIFENKEYSEDSQYTLEKHNCGCNIFKKVAVIMKRSPDLLFVLYHLFKNGITYIPIDPNYPKNRIEYFLNDSKPDYILSDNTMDLNYKIVDTTVSAGIAYIIYTSGTTGNPKGVEIYKDNVINLMEGISEIIEFSAGKRIASFASASFDMFVPESIMALDKGLTVVLSNDEEQRNPKLMANLIQKNGVDMMQMTPSRMQLLLNYDKNLSCLKNVKEIMIGGEPFPLSLLRTLQNKTMAKIYNMYGPTETTVWSTVSDLTNKKHIDIGRPIKNTKIFIVDENLNILPDGEAGEICIAGKSLAKGYVGNEDLTEEKFIYLPQELNTRAYRTGDFGRYMSDRNLEYFGRTDNQVKIHGHRIELEDIEAHLNLFYGIRQSVAAAIELNDSDKILKAFYTSEFNIKSKDIVKHLSSRLPSYMIPSTFTRVKEFIQTPTGKIDRKRVSECLEIKNHSNVFQEATSWEISDIQKKILTYIISNCNIKFINDISLDFELAYIGINSINFTMIIVLLECEFGIEFDLKMSLITAFPTIRTLLEYVEFKSTGA